MSSWRKWLSRNNRSRLQYYKCVLTKIVLKTKCFMYFYIELQMIFSVIQCIIYSMIQYQYLSIVGHKTAKWYFSFRDKKPHTETVRFIALYRILIRHVPFFCKLLCLQFERDLFLLFAINAKSKLNWKQTLIFPSLHPSSFYLRYVLFSSSIRTRYIPLRFNIQNAHT